MAEFKINQRGIDQMMREIQKGVNRSARRNPIRVPVGTSPSNTLSTHASSGTEEDTYLSKALLWLDDPTERRRGGFRDLLDFIELEHLPREDAAGIALQLEQHGLAQILRTWTEDQTTVRLTDAGRVEVRQLRKLADDKVARANYASDAVLRWLYDQGAPVEPSQFAGTRTAFFAGTTLTAAEITEAAVELRAHGLVNRETDSEDTNSYRLWITVAGTACVRGGHTVRSYMDSQNTTSTTTNYHGTVIQGGVSGGVVSTGDHNTINVGNGIDAQALAGLVQGLRDVTPQLGLNSVDAEDYAAEVEALERDGHDPAQGGRIWRRIMRLASSELATTIATGAGQQLLELGARLYS
ncbi:hypothetical protein ACFU6K_03105 [Kitasatospora sp. NPDC057512]|uniref:hypothetical protein n=1 Tax=Kitasatospora sp. NPDC057512 TaxID=3346154 RepID=UPI0036C1D997